MKTVLQEYTQQARHFTQDIDVVSYTVANNIVEELQLEVNRLTIALKEIAAMQDHDPDCSYYMEEAAKKALRGGK
ncbi:unnamed protein product [marine sediment metagenome]|uniref:Uncharacterized protein n=1 Tax=marine sediment metagenome TaxID=412755 RepID=X0U1E1_9ZZZZ